MAKTKKPKKSCVICGKKFTPRSSQHITCSPKCRQVRRNQTHLAWNKIRLLQRRTEKHRFLQQVNSAVPNKGLRYCRYCGKEIKNANRFFCTNTCRELFQGVNRTDGEWVYTSPQIWVQYTVQDPSKVEELKEKRE